MMTNDSFSSNSGDNSSEISRHLTAALIAMPQSKPLKQPKRAKPWSNPALYKTRLCDTYQQCGVCRYGSQCWYAHGMHELRYVPHLQTNPTAAGISLVDVIHRLPPSTNRAVAIQAFNQKLPEVQQDIFMEVVGPVLSNMNGTMKPQKPQRMNNNVQHPGGSKGRRAAVPTLQLVDPITPNVTPYGNVFAMSCSQEANPMLKSPMFTDSNQHLISGNFWCNL